MRDLDGEYEVEQNVEVGGHTFDLLWHSDGEREVVVAAEFDDAEA